MSLWPTGVDPRVASACRAYVEGATISDERHEAIPGGKGSVLRVRFSRGDDSAVRTEIRTTFLTRIIADAKPLGAVLILLEVAKRQTHPGRLVALTGDRAGEYPDGALEAAWGTLTLEGTGLPFLAKYERPGTPRRVTLRQVQSLAESVLSL